MGKALYRTYRSKKLSEIVGQEHITTALDHALTKGTISHAYLFTGPRGVGKTSIARILAHEINELPYEEDANHLDIIEIDAASNRRIDEIRDLRDKVHIAPSSAKYKVYIIDEVHMLTKEAFNALLKTLEEPPAHVIFILATTEVHKLPETIISRTQRYAFKPVDQPKVVDHLKHIASEEKINVSDEALALIAQHGEGSFRDSISLLDQVRNSGKKVELKDVQAVLGIAPAELITDIVKCVSTHNSVKVAACLTQMHDQGFEASQIAKQICASLREATIAGKAPLAHDATMKLMTELVSVSASPDPRVALEIALLDATLYSAPAAKATEENKVMPETIQTVAPAVEIKPSRAVAQSVEHRSPKVSIAGSSPVSPAKTEEPGKEELKTEEKPKPKLEELRAADTELSDAAVDSELLLTDKSWELILSALKTKYNTLHSVAKMAQPHYEPGRLTLEFTHAFHAKRISEAKNKAVLIEVIAGVTGSELQITCIKGEGRTLKPPSTPMPPAEGEIAHSVGEAYPASDNFEDESVDTISNIFGGAEVLES
ncbi:MAG TPA: DNA polymerase III subunit gamma/tau [Candidatus Saccharimonadales bacterium]|nr:DNA polymerase III subunit gamma/tau [Candidatus Saccharimonadales bacterium]